MHARSLGQAARRLYFEALAEVVTIPAASLELDLDLDPQLRTAGLVRHFEDAAKVIASTSALPALGSHANAMALTTTMLAERQLAARPDVADAAFAPDSSPSWQAVRRAYAASAPMYWGPRIPLDDACAAIRGWIGSTLA